MSEIKTAAQVKKYIQRDYLDQLKNVAIGLPEYNDRTRKWRTNLLFNEKSLGLVYYDAKTGQLDQDKSTSIPFLKQRLKLIKENEKIIKKVDEKRKITLITSPL